jgi:hypothetical protein
MLGLIDWSFLESQQHICSLAKETSGERYLYIEWGLLLLLIDATATEENRNDTTVHPFRTIILVHSALD